MNDTQKVITNRFISTSRSGSFNNLIREFDLSNKKVLDIGCSNGEYLCKFGKGSVGLTVNQEEVDYGNSVGLDIRIGNLEEEYDINEEFDIIFANNIFEHLYSPHHFLQKIKSKLSPDGILILGVPCVPILSFLLNFRRFKGALASAHINFFNKVTLQKTVEFAGWKVLDSRSFYLGNRFLSSLLSPISPHFYVIAKVDRGFKYDVKRLKELAGYNDKYATFK